MLKLLILDMDGLMLDTEQLYFSAFSTVCDRHGLSDCYDIYLKTVGADDDYERMVYTTSFPHLDGALFHAEVQAVCAQLMDAGRFQVKPGLFELLDAVDQMGSVRKAVVTSNREEVAAKLLSQAGILDRLDGGVFREMVSRGKPAPDAHLFCCRKFSVSPQEALVLEDSEYGLLAAQAAGIPVIAVPDLIEPSPQTLSKCLARCGRLDDVIPYLRNF